MNYFFWAGAGVGVVAGTTTGFTCIGAGAADFGAAGAADFGALAGAPRRSSVGIAVAPAFLVATIDNEIDVSIKRIAESVVAFDSNVADPRGPKAVWEPIPPKAPARSAALPLCSSTTTIRNRHTTI